MRGAAGSSVRAFVVTTPMRDVDLVSDVLWGLGVRAIEERSTPQPEVAPEGDTETLVELWTAVGEDRASIQRGADALGGRWAHRVVDVATGSADTWREFAQPMRIDEVVVIVPAWQHTPEADPDQERVDGNDPLEVLIEPGGAFGLGDHPTTRASLRAVVRLIAEASDHEPAGVDVLDVGCGTGVIAIVSALLQPRPVRAIDVAAAAVEATVDNARRNGVEQLVEVDASPLAAVEGTYGVVAANILAPALIAMADDLRRVTRADGHLVISGILAGSHDHVLAALAPMRVVHTDVDDGWACVTLRH